MDIKEAKKIIRKNPKLFGQIVKQTWTDDFNNKGYYDVETVRISNNLVNSFYLYDENDINYFDKDAEGNQTNIELQGYRLTINGHINKVYSEQFLIKIARRLKLKVFM